jgi:diacylglycerol kinase (ATP)
MPTPRREGFSAAALLRSFAHALRGAAELMASQRNARIHALATVAVVALALWLGVTRLEWALLVLAMGAVWTAEALNTALEWLCDVASPEYHPLVRSAKDTAAAGVLLAAAAAVVLGLLVLGPPLAARLAAPW